MSDVVMAARAISKQGNVLQSNKASTNEGIHLGKFNFQLDVIFCYVANVRGLKLPSTGLLIKDSTLGSGGGSVGRGVAFRQQSSAV